MGYEIRIGHQDLLKCRFAISPAWETWQAVRTLGDARQQSFHLPWLRGAKHRASRLDLEPLLALQVTDGYEPDFVSPIPQRAISTISNELEVLCQTPPDIVTSELTRCLAHQPDPRARRHIEGLLEKPDIARERIADLLERCWTELVEPDWPKIRHMLDADIAFRAQKIMEDGFGAVINAIDSSFSFIEDVLQIKGRHSERHDLAGAGIVLRPSVFTWPYVLFVPGQAGQAALSYPVRGIGALWLSSDPPTSDPLSRLIGRNRAMLLAGLGTPATTTSLARRYGLSASGTSAHLSALRDAGLVTTYRNGREVLYSRTPLGDSLLKATFTSP